MRETMQTQDLVSIIGEARLRDLVARELKDRATAERSSLRNALDNANDGVWSGAPSKSDAALIQHALAVAGKIAERADALSKVLDEIEAVSGHPDTDREGA